MRNADLANPKNKNPIILTHSLFFATLFLTMQLATTSYVFSSETMEGGNYRLKLQQVQKDDPTPTRMTPSSPTPVVAQTSPIAASGVSEVLATDNFIQFGPLSPTNPVLRQITFYLKTDLAEMVLYQQTDGPLQNQSAQSIPPTSCDTGSCKATQASMWKSTLSFGLGMRCDNREKTSCADDFVEKNAFRSLGNDVLTSIASLNAKEDAEINLNYKVNVPGTQSEGSYITEVTYLFLPKL